MACFSAGLFSRFQANAGRNAKLIGAAAVYLDLSCGGTDSSESAGTECLETQREALRPTGIISSDKWRPKVLGRAVFVAGFPVGCAAAAPAYNPSVYAGANQAFPSGYARGTPFKMSCSPNTNQSGAPIPNRAPTHSTVYCG
ncbi:uncharacterized protein LOC119008732 isoform X1 [Acanthopagrus latus]|uniref:uncharacterized protein LOC119008732 isoform X1 n=1 Tax=Acanthopagrus latus TaxID=8177 RepID=UPI00187BE499|nr:uncharacterized protein LOC119008732 isoform X1 [Acanthopagrus latus]